MTAPTDELAELWRWFATTQCRGDSPLYERIALAVADDTETLALVHRAPPAAHLPPALLAAVHYLLLAGLDHPLADVYAGSAADPAPLFFDICRTHGDEILGLLAERRVQTNDCGRSAVIGLGLTWLAPRLGDTFCLVDVGASAGINLLCDRYRLDYGPAGATGPNDSLVRIDCRIVGGDPPVAPRLPSPAVRLGIDRSPIDLTDPDDARWLLACVWPDTGRMTRTAASIDVVRRDPPRLTAGPALEVLPDVLATLPQLTPVVVVTTSAAAYLSVDERVELVSLLTRASHDRPLAWFSAEGPGVVTALAPSAAADGQDHTHCDTVGVVAFDAGVVSAQLLGFANNHGMWIDWRSPPTAASSSTTLLA